MQNTLPPALRDWLLDTDVALRWQVERDLLGSAAGEWEATRARVATEGFGAELRSRQDPDGQWAGGAFFPADFDFSSPDAADGSGQPWTATTWSLNSLREWGVDASDLDGTAAKLAANSRWEYNDGPYWQGEVDCCINAWALANGAWLGADVSSLVEWFPQHRLADGGWNCEWVEGSTRSSFDSTLNSLKGILAYEMEAGRNDELSAARRGGAEYLLQRRLLYSLSTGEILGPRMTRLAYPFRSFYSALNAVDYLRSASLFDGTPPDARPLRSMREPGRRSCSTAIAGSTLWMPSRNLCFTARGGLSPCGRAGIVSRAAGDDDCPGRQVAAGSMEASHLCSRAVFPARLRRGRSSRSAR